MLSDCENNRFVRSSPLPPTRLHAWERVALAELPAEFVPLALSPLCPFATSSSVASVDQNWAVSTARNTEVVSDATNVLALECALRRRALLSADPRSAEPVHLATNHRLVRAQFFDGPNLFAHFGLFGLCTASRTLGSAQFELSALALHTGFYLRAIRAFAGIDVALQVSVTDQGSTDRRDLLETGFLGPIRETYSNVDCVIDSERTQGRGYYLDLCFHIGAT